MASLIPGYEYDIFISYRQKDNKGDRWVSEFVEALKTELESTFKEEISVYFDINPHDGLLETHDVDASLKDKLKCLVFIPIISRTYCDPKSFAWEHEFKAFIKEASGDQFGLNVKLPNGNMTSRILPVRIHDLDPEDIRLLETQIDLIQQVDFVYYSEGVNRPLRKQDDTAQDMKQLIYRDQVNKTALAVKGIILGLKGVTDLSFKATTGQREQPQERTAEEMAANSKKKKFLIGFGVLATLIIAVILFYPGILGWKNLDRLISKDGRISIAVMPFQNITNDTSMNVWQGGIQSNLITSLSNSEDLKVRQLETITGILESKGLTENASLTPSVASLISQKLEANVLITGSIKQSGSILRLNAQLIDAKKEEAFKSFQVDGTADGIFTVIDSLSRLVQDFLVVSVMNKRIKYSMMYGTVGISTKSAEAFRYSVNGDNAWVKQDWMTAIDWYMRALKADSSLYDAYGLLSQCYFGLDLYDEAKKWCLIAYNKRDLMDRGSRLWVIQFYQSVFCKDDYDPTKFLRQSIEIDDQEPSSYRKLGDRYYQRLQYDKAISEYKKALEIYNKWGIKVSSVYTSLGRAYRKTGQYRKAKKIYKKAERDFPDNPQLIAGQAVLSLTLRDTVAANQYIKKYILIQKYNSSSEANISLALGQIYWGAGMLDKAEEYYRKALSLDPENPVRLNALAAFLIEIDRNKNESLNLIDKAIKLSPDNLGYLDTKGWGLYKLGKYKEALELIQKSWDSLPFYVYEVYSHLEAAKKALEKQK